MNGLTRRWDWIFGIADDDMGLPRSGNWHTFKVVNTDDYEIRPKRDYLNRRIKEMEERVKELESTRDNTVRYYDGRIMEAKAEIERLKKET